MAENRDIGDRLREFGEKRFGSMSAFAKALEMTPQSLQSYLTGHRLPGRKIIGKLEAVGCNIIWLISGLKPEEIDPKFEKMIERIAKERGLVNASEALRKADPKKEEAYVAFHAPAGMDPETRKTIQKLIDDISELDYGDVERARQLVKAAFKKKK